MGGDGQERADRVGPLERRLARGHPVQDAAKAEQVAAVIDSPALGLLGRHVRRCADDRPLLRELAFLPAARARPKSRIFTRSVPASSQTLAGLMSRWMSSRLWAAASPSAISRPMRSTSATGSLPSRFNRTFSVSPSRNSMARKGTPRSSPTW